MTKKVKKNKLKEKKRLEALRWLKSKRLEKAKKAYGLLGKKVRIVKEVAGHLANYGMEGIVSTSRKGLVTLEVGASLRKVQDVPRRAVVKSQDFKAKASRNLTTLSKAQKRQILEEADCAGSGAGDHVEALKDQRILAQHVVMQTCWVKHMLEVPAGAPVKVVYPMVYQAWQACEDEQEEEEAGERKADLEGWFRRALEDNDLILVQCWASQGEGSEHFTLLVLDFQVDAGSECKVRYYDTLQVESFFCRAKALQWLMMAQRVLEGTSRKVPNVLPERCNKVRQDKGLGECGYHVCWYSEEELRHWRGEGWGSRGRSDIKALKVKMASLTNSMMKERAAWLEEQKKLEAKAKAKAKAKAVQDEKVKLAEDTKATLEALRLKAEELYAKKAPQKELIKADEHWAAEVLKILPDDMKATVEKVKATGYGVCGTCRWSHGCWQCFWPKAVRYWAHKAGVEVPKAVMAPQASVLILAAKSS